MVGWWVHGFVGWVMKIHFRSHFGTRQESMHRPDECRICGAFFQHGICTNGNCRNAHRKRKRDMMPYSWRVVPAQRPTLMTPMQQMQPLPPTPEPPQTSPPPTRPLWRALAPTGPPIRRRRPPPTSPPPPWARMSASSRSTQPPTSPTPTHTTTMPSPPAKTKKRPKTMTWSKAEVLVG